MLKILQTKFSILFILLIFNSISKADVKTPNKNILPSEVVKIQLTGLQNNDLNFKDGNKKNWKLENGIVTYDFVPKRKVFTKTRYDNNSSDI